MNLLDLVVVVSKLKNKYDSLQQQNGVEDSPASLPFRARAVEITSNVILDQDQVQAIYFDLRSDQCQIKFVIFLTIEKIKI